MISISELFSRSWKLFLKMFLVLLTIGLPITVIEVLSNIYNNAVGTPGVFPGSMITLSLLLAVLGIVAGAAQIFAIHDSSGATGFLEAYGKAFANLWSIIWVGLMVGAAVIAGLFVFFVPGIYLAVLFSFALYAVVLEGQKGTEALKRSTAYVRGRWWGIFGYFIALALTLICFSLVADIILPNKTVIGVIGMSIVNLLISTFSACYGYLLYKEVKRSANGPKKSEAAAK
ncbi:MAG: hypothetical protein Q8Q20_00275 [bacterium]|nr:hypothetical protein [bacterium]